MEIWKINLSLIPSIAVILTSANRIALGLTDEINLQLINNPEAYKHILPLKIEQLKRVSMAIVIMYTSLAVLVLNALLTGTNILRSPYDMYLIFVAILIFFVGLHYKIMFAGNALFIRQKQFEIYMRSSGEAIID